MGWRYGKSENVSIIGRRSVWGWRYAHKNRFTGPLLLHLNRTKPSPIIILSLRIFVNSISVPFKNFPQKNFTLKVVMYYIGLFMFLIAGALLHDVPFIRFILAILLITVGMIFVILGRG